jgi:hypothetical protein
LLHRFCQLATLAVENVNLGHVFEIDLIYQTHPALAVRARWRRSEFGHGQVALGGMDESVNWGRRSLTPSRLRPTRAQRSTPCLQIHIRRHERFAKGEIQKPEYDEKKAAILSGARR